jgi:hypothetical protein
VHILFAVDILIHFHHVRRSRPIAAGPVGLMLFVVEPDVR